MPIIDFKEIPKAHIADGKQDTFELFCQEFLKFLNLEVISTPDRGADGGSDLICVEHRDGSFGSTQIRWLVSCKHKAHSGASVTPTDEQNITDRLEQHKANGFIAFYSTLPSSGLNSRLDSIKHRCETIVFNSESIEGTLLESPRGKSLFKRFFPESYKKWKRNEIEPVTIYSKYEALECDYCGRDILGSDVESDNGSLIGLVRDPKFSEENNYHAHKIVDIYYSCKGLCDDALEEKYEKKGYVVDWKDIQDLKIPIENTRWIMAILNNFHDQSIQYENNAFEKLKRIIMGLNQYIVREQSDKESAREDILNMLPEWLR